MLFITKCGVLDLEEGSLHTNYLSFTISGGGWGENNKQNTVMFLILQALAQNPSQSHSSVSILRS